MTSLEPNQDNHNDDLFDQDMAELLSDFDAQTKPKNELASLFDDDFADSVLDKEEEKGFDSVSLSSLPSEDEINQLFNDDFVWDEPSVIQQQPNWNDFSSSSVKEEQQTEIAANFFADLEGEVGDKFSLNANDDAFAELDQLLAGNEQPTLPQPVPLEELLPTLKLIPYFCESFADLEALLEQSISLGSKETVDFQALEALIDAPTPIPKPEKHEGMEIEPDDKFKDLEELLKQADRTMGGPPMVSIVGGQRSQSRNRPQKANLFEQTMRVPVKQLDNLGNLIGELVIKRNRLEQDQERVRQFLDKLLNQVQSLSDVGGRMQDLYERTLLEGALLATRSQGRNFSNLKSSDDDIAVSYESSQSNQGLDALEMDRFTGFHLLSQEMIELTVRVRESASDIQFVVDETDQVARSLRQATTQLQEGMNQSRMVPFAQTADRLPRAVREICLQLDKEAQLNVEGREVFIDKMILEHLYDPMTHLVNNAITHGIETPAVRHKLGKPTKGIITVRAFLQGNQPVITVSDDGAGINPERVKAKAVEKGLLTPTQANNLTTQEVYDLLFHAGFSTKDKADSFSGRGVGLDVVRKGLSEIRGGVTIDSVIGKGTTFTVRLPLTLSICKALCCLSDRARIAFPMDGIEDQKNFLPSDLQPNAEGQISIPWGETSLPVYPLSELISYNRQLSRGTLYGGKPEEDTVPIVILRSTGNLLAVRVDEVIGEQEIVIKQIEGPVPKPPGIAGATVLGDGSIMPIGDVLELIEIAQGRLRTDHNAAFWRSNASPPPTEFLVKTNPTVLIVDDSITVRELLSLSFRKAGYRVEQARDGQEAWEKLRAGLPCDIVFCDIEMPRMNGLELLSNLQKDENLADIPVALLTSRGADRHRKVAAKLGASGYLTKPYTEKDLLDAAKRMIRGEVLLSGSIKVVKSLTGRDKYHNEGDTYTYQGMSSATELKAGSLVLIIDDSVTVREMLSNTFAKAGYQIAQARDGQEAWEKLRSGLPCELILCDIEMPRMNGLELLSRLQEDEQLAVIPVAMITSRGAQKMQKMAAERGAKGYFVKPYIEEVLLDAAKRLIAGEVLLDAGSLVEG